MTTAKLACCARVTHIFCVFSLSFFLLPKKKKKKSNNDYFTRRNLCIFFPISRIPLRYKSERLAEFVFPQKKKKGRGKKNFYIPSEIFILYFLPRVAGRVAARPIRFLIGKFICRVPYTHVRNRRVAQRYKNITISRPQHAYHARWHSSRARNVGCNGSI